MCVLCSCFMYPLVRPPIIRFYPTDFHTFQLSRFPPFFPSSFPFFFSSQTALLVPGFVFSLVSVLNLFVWSQHSSSAIPFGTFFALMLMWFGISLPLVFIGAYFGERKKAIEHPVRTNQIPRQIPEQVWYLKPVVR